MLTKEVEPYVTREVYNYPCDVLEKKVKVLTHRDRRELLVGALRDARRERTKSALGQTGWQLVPKGPEPVLSLEGSELQYMLSHRSPWKSDGVWSRSESLSSISRNASFVLDVSSESPKAPCSESGTFQVESEEVPIVPSRTRRGIDPRRKQILVKYENMVWSMLEKVERDSKNAARLAPVGDPEDSLVLYLPIEYNGEIIIEEDKFTRNLFRNVSDARIGYRKSKQMDDKADTCALESNGVVVGADEGDGWIKVLVSTDQANAEVNESSPRFRTPRWTYDGHAGTLKVIVVSGHDLKAANASAEGLFDSDGYVYVEVAGQRLRTPAIQENSNPVWDCTFHFCIDEKHLRNNVVFNVFDSDEPDEDGGKSKNDDFLGNLSVPLSRVLAVGTLELVEAALQNTTQGAISVKMYFFPKQK